jgi:hypothetical protein
MCETSFLSKSPTCRPGGERFGSAQEFENVIEVPILGVVLRKVFLQFLQSFEQYYVDHLEKFEQ